MFLINLPYHKRWMLPDGKHYYDSQIYGDQIKITIWRVGKFGALDDLVLSVPVIRIDQRGTWKDHCEIAQKLAERKFCSNAERFRRSHNRYGTVK